MDIFPLLLKASVKRAKNKYFSGIFLLLQNSLEAELGSSALISLLHFERNRPHPRLVHGRSYSKCK